MKIRIITAAALIVSTQAAAKVPQAEADKLCGAELTCVGAERKGNTDGTIPEWVGRQSKHFSPESFSISYKQLSSMTQEQERKLSEAVYAEKPKLVITKANMAQFADKLTEGHKWLLTSYPTYKIPVYTSERNAFFPEPVEQASKKNAATASLNGTDDVKDAVLGFPFPIAQNGAEAIWNHKMKYLAENARRYNNQAIVNFNGSYTITKLIEDVKFKYANLKDRVPSNQGVLVYYMSETLAPPKDEGQILLVHELIGGEGRKAWLYNPGQRRVRLAPNVAYDNPGTAADGLRTSDDFGMYNGAIDRYEWKLVGKQEMYIPYNSYKLSGNSLKYADILKPGHINPEHARYELHRVWVVEANLKPGASHIYKRRVFYIDEDSWAVVVTDKYDARDQLWRVSEQHSFNFYDVPMLYGTVEVHHDLQSGRYIAMGLRNEESKVYRPIRRTAADYTPANLRNLGTR